MTRDEALEFLAETVREAIVDAECDVCIFTGEECFGRPNRIAAASLAEALEVMGFGFERAASRVRKECGLEGKK